MRKAYVTSAVAGAFLLGMAMAALAEPASTTTCVRWVLPWAIYGDRLLHQWSDWRQDLLLRQRRGQDHLHEGPARQSR